MYARMDLPIYAKSLARCENFIVIPQGGARYRAGTTFVKNTRLNKLAALIPFQFSDQQAYLIEATDKKFRFYKDNGIITGVDVIIDAMTNANPGVFTSDTVHNLSVGMTITLDNMNGTTGLSGTKYHVHTVPTTTTFTLEDYNTAVTLNTTSVGTFTPIGKFNRNFEISGITQANPGVVTVTAHGLLTGQEVLMFNMQGMTELNNKFYLVVKISANTFSLTDINGNAINTTTFPAFIKGEESPIYELTTPYLEADIYDLQFSQNADTMYITNQIYEPMKLVRIGHADWTLSTFVRTADPFDAGDWPRCVQFTDSGRLMYANTPAHPETIWGSREPISGDEAYDDFTTSTGPTALATDAFIFTLAPLQGKTDAIQWLANNNAFTLAGTFSTVRNIYGSAEDQPISPLSVTAKSIGNYGCSSALPISSGFSLFHIQRASRIMRSIEYDITINGYTTTDRTLVADHLTINGVRQIILQQSNNDIIWAVTGDGRPLALTFKEKEDISGWSRHYLGGSNTDSNGLTLPRATVLAVGPMTRPTNGDQVWFVAERTINGQTVRSVEYMNDFPIFPLLADFFTGDEDSDNEKFLNALYETQKQSIHLDMSITYDGSDIGAINNANITVMPVTGSAKNSVTVTADQLIFTADMVGRQIWGQFDLNGNGGGRFVIDAFVSATVVTGHTLVDFLSISEISAGEWYLTTSSLSGLDHLEGETVSAIVDGGTTPDVVITNGSTTIPQQASVVTVGYKYRGVLEFLNIDLGGQTGPASSKNRNLYKITLDFYNSLGTQFGTDYYELETLTFRSTASKLDRPPPPLSGHKAIPYPDRWETDEKRMIVMQTVPMPCTLRSLDFVMNTADE